MQPQKRSGRRSAWPFKPRGGTRARRRGSSGWTTRPCTSRSSSSAFPQNSSGSPDPLESSATLWWRRHGVRTIVLATAPDSRPGSRRSSSLTVIHPTGGGRRFHSPAPPFTRFPCPLALSRAPELHDALAEARALLGFRVLSLSRRSEP